MAHTLPTEVFHEIVQFFDAKQCGELLTVSTTFLDLTTAALLKLHESCLSFQPPAPHFPVEIFYNAMLIIIIVSVSNLFSSSDVGAFQLQQKVEQVQLQMQHKVEQVQMQMQQKMEQVQMQHKVEQVQMQQKMEQVQIQQKVEQVQMQQKMEQVQLQMQHKVEQVQIQQEVEQVQLQQKVHLLEEMVLRDRSPAWMFRFLSVQEKHNFLNRLMKNDKFDGSTEGQRLLT
uniref:F-box domain-containing protein n=1 Tax=Ditylenchus dipsaci TaxID=166011 RepID=A0A915CKR6_9BILA